MKHGSLFSGIGGFDLAAEWMGWENIFHCEWNEFGKKVLNYYWPEAISYEDITKTDFTIHRGKIDILTGGFPCQPYSHAGKRLGKEDDRHLWPEMLRAIREIRPSFVVGENVSGILSWNEGVVFNEVQTDLEDEGYEVQPVLLPACSVNAPHRRDRIWFVAHRINQEQRESTIEGLRTELGGSNKGEVSGTTSNAKDVQRNSKRKEGEQFGSGGNAWSGIKRDVSEGNATDTDRGRRIQDNEQQQTEELKYVIPSWDIFPTQSPVCNGNDGISSRLDGITFPKWRSESIKAGGNAIVPQVAYQIFKALEKLWA